MKQVYIAQFLQELKDKGVIWTKTGIYHAVNYIL